VLVIGAAAPRLVRPADVAAMRPGSVLVAGVNVHDGCIVHLVVAQVLGEPYAPIA
jgi:alanine dehydrogenase